MNNFATIKLISTYDKVVYYSVCLRDEEQDIEDESESLFELFIHKHTAGNKVKLNHILSWIRLIGKNYGAQSDFFRNEAETADTTALPPRGIDREPTYIEDGENSANNLRLYCFRLNEHVVFLFNGDIKTAARAQDCDNVRPHFRLANKLTTAIDEQINDEIKWNEDQTDIHFDSEFELNW